MIEELKKSPARHPSYDARLCVGKKVFGNDYKLYVSMMISEGKYKWVHDGFSLSRWIGTIGWRKLNYDLANADLTENKKLINEIYLKELKTLLRKIMHQKKKLPEFRNIDVDD